MRADENNKMNRYDHKEIEAKWQKKWQEALIYKTPEVPKEKKHYVLDMFPYPSGDGLHVGHPKGYIATDIYSRYKKMNGHDILHPMGFDAFGLPAENFAIKNKIHPRLAVEKNIKRFKEQLGKLGFNYDWDREVNTTDPEYYKWTQWIFLKLLEEGLAYESYEPINWCPSCQTGLANEDLEDGKCERCGSAVVKKPMRQWVLKITDYADRLLADLDDLSWPEAIKESQRNWIGRSEGAVITFALKDESGKLKAERKDIEIFTTRADTLYGATYLVLAPEHDLLKEKNFQFSISNFQEVKKYISDTSKKEEIERTDAKKEKTGVELKGVKAINPATEEEIPVWVADYVLTGYGTGAVMAVPAHDERDFEFAKKYSLPIREVISPKENKLECYEGEGILINSKEFDGLNSIEAREKMTKKFGKETVKYKLRDWVFSRQRYWGEPIPVIHCERCGVVPVPEEDLPVRLPEVEHYEPTGTGESPLANISEWVNVGCPKCKGEAKRETNTMPQWAGSSWYYLRYIDNKNDKELVDKKKEKEWSPVDVYVGGAEHATRHLIYARFWHKFLFDIGAVNYSEPFSKLYNVGLILAEDGKKMSKRYNNVVNPDDVVETWGADTLRLYEMFMGPFGQMIAWSTDGLMGPRRFLERVWKLSEKVVVEGQSNYLVFKSLQKTIKKVGEDIENFKFNTAISAMMIFVNEAENSDHISSGDFGEFLKILSPFTPHITQELWHNLGNQNFIYEEKWPEYDEKLAKDDVVRVSVQIDGKVRDVIEVVSDITEEDIKETVLKLEKVLKYTDGRELVKFIYIPGRVVSIVTKD